MNSIADALVYAVAYLDCRDIGDGELDDDVGALESVAAFLHHATREEEDALAAAAHRAFALEQNAPSTRPDFIESYATWMENMFGDDWEGNQRVISNG